MQKDFQKWSTLKSIIEVNEIEIFANSREIWWCSLGENVGTELCGKNDLFERPVLVLKVFNRSTIKILPLTSKLKVGKYFVDVKFNNVNSSGSLSQVKTISTKRLSRKIGRIDKLDFENIVKVYKESL